MSHSIKRGTCQSRRNKTQTKERRPPPYQGRDIYKVTSRSWCIAKVTSQAASSTRMSKILTSLRVLITMVTELDHHGNGAQAFCLAVNVSVETERTNHLGRMRHTARAGSWRVEVTNKMYEIFILNTWPFLILTFSQQIFPSSGMKNKVSKRHKHPCSMHP